VTRLLTTNPFEPNPNTPSGGYFAQAAEKVAEREWQKQYGRSPADDELHAAIMRVLAEPHLLAEVREEATKMRAADQPQ